MRKEKEFLEKIPVALWTLKATNVDATVDADTDDANGLKVSFWETLLYVHSTELALEDLLVSYW